jgi:DNA repair exonuclease SbcCD nuclease subunit
VLIHLSSDYHLDATTSGLDRFHDVSRALRSVVAATIIAKKKGEDVAFVFGGDLCDPDTTRAFRAIAEVVEIALWLRRHDIPSVWIAGNHDTIESDRGATVLEPLKVLSEEFAGIRVFETPGFVPFADGTVVVALPHVARARAYDPDEWIRTASVLESRRVLVVGHLTVPGAERGSESDDFARGRDLVFPVEACRRRWGDRAILANGHYHRAQTTRDGVHIPGSLARLRHDEERHEPGYLVIKV